MLGLIGRKEKTGQLYSQGRAIQVTYITVLPNRIVQIKTKYKDGYQALQLTIDQKASHKVTQAELGHFKKANTNPGIGLWEFPLEATSKREWKLGDALNIEEFSSTKWIDVTGTTKGKGFAGVIKRHHFSSQDATHGNSLSHRKGGSIGQRTSPGRVFKGKKMPGQHGNKRRTIQSLEIFAIYPDHHLLVVKGSVPGAPGGILRIQPAVRRLNQTQKVS